MSITSFRSLAVTCIPTIIAVLLSHSAGASSLYDQAGLALDNTSDLAGLAGYSDSNLAAMFTPKSSSDDASVTYDIPSGVSDASVARTPAADNSAVDNALAISDSYLPSASEIEGIAKEPAPEISSDPYIESVVSVAESSPLQVELASYSSSIEHTATVAAPAFSPEIALAPYSPPESFSSDLDYGKTPEYDTSTLAYLNALDGTKSGISNAGINADSVSFTAAVVSTKVSSLTAVPEPEEVGIAAAALILALGALRRRRGSQANQPL